MKRRDFLKTTAATAAVVFVPLIGLAKPGPKNLDPNKKRPIYASDLPSDYFLRKYVEGPVHSSLVWLPTLLPIPVPNHICNEYRDMVAIESKTSHTVYCHCHKNHDEWIFAQRAHAPWIKDFKMHLCNLSWYDRHSLAWLPPETARLCKSPFCGLVNVSQYKIEGTVAGKGPLRLTRHKESFTTGNPCPPIYVPLKTNNRT